MRRVRVPGHAAESKAIATCPHCGLAVQREASHASRGLGELARAALAFVFTRDALFGLAATAVTCGFVNLIPLFATPLLGGVAVTYLAHLVRRTGEGRSITEPPDFVEVGDLVGPWLRMAIVVAYAFGPTLVALELESGVALVVALPWAVAYLPAGLILVSHRARWGKVLLPFTAIGIARAAGTAYVAMALASAPVLAASVAAWTGIERLAAVTIALPIVGTAIASALTLLLPTAYARFLGLWVREHRHELA